MSAEKAASYEDGILAEIYGDYDDRVAEYHFAVDRMYEQGILRDNSPILDIGCRNPYEGLLRFLREFAWDGEYVGIDVEFGEDAREECQDDDQVTLVQYNVDGGNLVTLDDGRPFLMGTGPEGVPQKQFACAFLLEVLEHIHDKESLIDQLKQVAATIIVIGPNADFEGYYHDVPGHVGDLTKDMLEEWGFQVTGYVNFNGRPDPESELYPMSGGECDTSSEVWGVWRDARAERMHRKRKTKNEWALEKGPGQPLKQVGRRPPGLKVIPGGKSPADSNR